MIPPLKPYPTYKSSGVEWLGKIPEHWHFPRVKTVFTERSEKGFPNEPMLAATQTKGVVRKEQYESRTVLALKDLHLLKLVRKGDFVISLRSFQGGIEYAHEQGIISPAYTIVSPKEPNLHDYLAKLLKSQPYIENLSLFVTGIRQGQNIDYEKLSRSRIPLPPSDEQAGIVRYLDYVGRRARRLVRAKRKLIALLAEQKQAIIHRAVTRGLDPDVPVKDSGVEWLGEVPAHWDIQKLKTGVSNITEQANQQQNEELYIGLENVQSWTGKLQGAEANDKLESLAKRFKANDVLFGKLRPYLAKVTRPSRGGVCSGEFLVLRPKAPDLSRSYLEMLLRSKRVIDVINSSTFGARMPRADWAFIGNLRHPLPPPHEQNAIVAHLDKATGDIDSAVARAKREIELLEEYRTRLIADVVTGKLDVREVAATLPETDPLAGDDGDEDGPGENLGVDTEAGRSET